MKKTIEFEIAADLETVFKTWWATETPYPLKGLTSQIRYVAGSKENPGVGTIRETKNFLKIASWKQESEIVKYQAPHLYLVEHRLSGGKAKEEARFSQHGEKVKVELNYEYEFTKNGFFQKLILFLNSWHTDVADKKYYHNLAREILPDQKKVNIRYRSRLGGYSSKWALMLSPAVMVSMFFVMSFIYTLLKPKF